jgi:putative membrane protein
MYKIFDSVQLFAQTPSSSWELLGQHLLAAIIFSIVGVIVFFASLLLMEKLTPFSIIKEIGEEHNLALAIIVGAIVLGIAIIIASAVLG